MEYNVNPETLIPTAPLPRLRQAERRIEVLEAAKRDLELQRDELLRFVVRTRTNLWLRRLATLLNDIDAVIAYCEEFTASERAEEASLDFDMETVEEIAY